MVMFMSEHSHEALLSVNEINRLEVLQNLI